MFILICWNATTFLRVFRTLVLFFVISVGLTDSCFVSTHHCIYGATPFVSTMATGSTGAYGGLEESPETTPMLVKKEPEVNTSGSSYNTPDWRSSRHSSPPWDLFISTPCCSHCHSSDNYCLFVSIQLEKPSDETAAGESVPTGALTNKIIRLYLSPIISDMTQIVILNNTDFLVYKGWWSKGKGMTYEEAATYLRDFIGSRDWVGFPVIIRATPLHLGKARCEFLMLRSLYKLSPCWKHSRNN